MKIYGKRNVIIGLVIFVLFFTSPFWLNITSWGTGKPALDPKLDTPRILEMEEETGEKHCVESLAYMKTSHMLLLDEWRTAVVRDGDRTYEGSNNMRYEMSLSNTCMDCHSNKSQFCDVCHNSMDISPYCWDCHVAPTESTEAEETEE